MNKAMSTPAVLKQQNQQKIISKLDDAVVLNEATRRRARLREERGPYATMIKLRRCPHCHGSFSTRKLREHLPQCPERQRYGARLSGEELAQRLYRVASRKHSRTADELCRLAEVPCTKRSLSVLDELVQVHKLTVSNGKFQRV